MRIAGATRITAGAAAMLRRWYLVLCTEYDVPSRRSRQRPVPKINEMKTSKPIKPQNGPVKETFRDGTLAAKGSIQAGQKHGAWKYYFRNGKLRATGKYAAGQLDGPWKWYPRKRQTAADRPLQGRQARRRCWKRYRENGKLYDEGKFAAGKKTGTWKIYDAAGKLSRTKTF